jgi:hypothetical protein
MSRSMKPVRYVSVREAICMVGVDPDKETREDWLRVTLEQLEQFPPVVQTALKQHYKNCVGVDMPQPPRLPARSTSTTRRDLVISCG